MDEALTGKIIIDDGKRWRIINSDEHTTECVNMEGTKLEFKQYETPILMKSIEDSITLIEAEESKLTSIPEMTEAEKASFEQRCNFIRSIQKAYGHSFILLGSKGHKEAFEEILAESGLSRKAAWKYIARFLRSGLMERSLLDKRLVSWKKGMHFVGTEKSKSGPKGKTYGKIGKILDKTDLERMNMGVERFKRGPKQTMRDSYDYVINKYYAGCEEYPSEKQFRAHVARCLSKQDIKAIKVGSTEFRNSFRDLYATARYDGLRPGQVIEADETELDIAVVDSETRSINLGRPVMYVLMDLYSHAVVAVSVHLHNNSNAGMNAVMLNLFESKTEYCKRMGITFTDNGLFWPTGFCPEKIRADNGSEYDSDVFEKLCGKLNIIRDMVPKATGSYKGTVERTHGIVINALKPVLEGCGLITKDHGSNHYETAVLTVEETTRLVIEKILEHNNTIIEKLRITRDMVNRRVGRVPMAIWHYGIAKYGAPAEVNSANRIEYMLKMMKTEDATITREGIRCKGLIYIDAANPRSHEERDTSKGTRTEVLLDPRDTTHVFWNKDNKLKRLSLAPDIYGNTDYAGISWREKEIEKEIENEQDRKDRLAKDDIRRKDQLFAEGIVEEAVHNTVFKPSKKNMKEARAREKEKLDERESISKRIAAAENESTKEELGIEDKGIEVDYEVVENPVSTSEYKQKELELYTKEAETDENKETIEADDSEVNETIIPSKNNEKLKGFASLMGKTRRIPFEHN